MNKPCMHQTFHLLSALSLTLGLSGCQTETPEETPETPADTSETPAETPAAQTTPWYSELDLTHLIVGDDSNILVRNEGAEPASGTLWLCGLPPDGAGAPPSDDWLNPDGTWDYTRKPRVPGEVMWESQLELTLFDAVRLIQGNGLPSTPTGIFPIPSDSEAYQYDRNPSSIAAQEVDLTFDAIPTYLDTPYCMPYGANGISLTGSAIYHGASTLGTDAAAYEMLDECGGHSDGTSTYHYHMLTECLLQRLDAAPSGHSALMGYMMDGFGLFGPRGEDGMEMQSDQLDDCHGHTHTIPWDGQELELYHYHWVFDFPYNAGCMRGTPVTPWNGKDSTRHIHPH